MRLILMGTGPFAVPSFAALQDSPHEVLAVVTRPVPPTSGRRQEPQNPVRQWAAPVGPTILSPPDVNDPSVHPQLANRKADLLVVCDYGQILSDHTLATTRLGGINLHGSLLPKYRGAAPVNWCLWHGDPETGVSVIHMTPRLDAGPVLAVRKTPIQPDEDAVALEQRLARLGVAAVQEAIAMLETWDGQTPLGVRQQAEAASRAPRLKKSDGRVDWSRSASQIRNQVRAFKPWPGTFTTYRTRKGEQRLILDQVSVVPQSRVPDPGPPGTVVRSEADQLWVMTGQDALAIERIQPAGKRVLSVDEFLRGHPLATGDQLGR